MNAAEGLDGRYGEWVREFNLATRTKPAALLAAMVGSEFALLGTTYTLLSMAESAIPADLAVAYMVNRVLKRFRMPVDLAVTATIARLLPNFTHAKLTRVLSKPFAQLAAARRAPADPTKPGPSFMGIDRDGNVTSKWLRPVTNVIDSYGVLYALGARLTGVASTLTIYALLRSGTDVQALTEWAGVAAAGNTAGAFAATVLLTSTAYFPVCILGAPSMARQLQQRLPMLFKAEEEFTGSVSGQPRAESPRDGER